MRPDNSILLRIEINSSEFDINYSKTGVEERRYWQARIRMLHSAGRRDGAF
jgi:hypothetical protein